MSEPVDLEAFRRQGLDERQRRVLDRVQAGADCGLCGDLGAYDPHADRGVPCLCCGEAGEA